mgnify:FL=1
MSSEQKEGACCRSQGPGKRLIRVVGLAAVSLMAIGSAEAQGSTGRNGKEVVAAVCQTCHGPGLNGAPKIGDRSAWAARSEQGLTNLTAHAIQGIRNMPAHGGDPKLSDLEIARAVTYMVNQSGGRWVEPVSARDIPAERTGEQVVKAQCSKCHDKGSEGAPIIGDRNQWVPRMQRGIDALTRSAIAGHGGMPARGGEANLTDNEIRSAILYMFNPAPAAGKATAGAHGHDTAPAVVSRGNSKTVDGLDINLGFQRAESLLSFPEPSIERTMHGGVPKGRDYYHINVTLADHATGTLIDNAQVEVEFGEVGLASQTKRLELMTGAGGASYGEYIRMTGKTLYQVTVRVQRPGAPRMAEARFTHRVN